MVRHIRKIITLILIAAVVLLPFGGCYTTGGTSGGGTSSMPQAGSIAPDFQLQDLQGNTFSLSGLKGRPVMLNFWATWCPPCREEMPLLQQVYEEWTGKPPSVVIFAVNIGESQATVEKFMRDNNYSLRVLLDTSQTVAGKYRINGIPTTYFIDKDGVIQGVKVGAFQSVAQIESYLGKIVP